MRWKKIVATAAVMGALSAALFGASPANASGTVVKAGVPTPYCQTHVFNNAANDGALPNQTLWCQFQDGPAEAHGYTGPIDGVMGVNSWKGMQTFLQSHGYTGPIDGVPGTNTYRAMQKWAADAGHYGGPQDGVMGVNSWNGVALTVKIQYFGL
ncbi:hypothetical protein [Compostimonas suwonensis]|uniref:Peptidoglycan binding protein n=1 Tax=Compostimonas suwonensis TaxID=1048394 RepID=A0A2M9BC45_9MICO|nr:hypothetical protein [Compostimonas suwonensis]PJJ55521.1 hypothetical protein CLV54_2867 [Compostimonas suwonensis]